MLMCEVHFAGHHWHRRDVRFDSYHTMVRNVLQHLKNEFTGPHIVFRTSSWGHHRCFSHPALPAARLSSAPSAVYPAMMPSVRIVHCLQQTDAHCILHPEILSIGRSE